METYRQMSLHPDLHHFLTTFDARRRKLLYARGLLAGLAVLLGCVLIGGLLDIALGDEYQTHLVFSCAIYVSAIFVVWLRGVRPLLRIRTPLELARALEHTSPALRGELLSAVELSFSPAVALDSQIFRELHQQRTAEKVASIRSEHLLPWGNLKTDAIFFGLFVILLTSVVMIEGEVFENRCLRLLLPFADINHLSETQIEVLAPAPKSGDVPADETTRVVAKIIGKEASQPLLLVSSIAQGTKRIPMEPAGDHCYQADLNLATDPIDYQIKAGNAQSLSYHLAPAQRPHVVSYKLEYTPPAYSGLQSWEVTSSDGGIKAIEGTCVVLKLKMDQAVSSGTLYSSQGTAVEPVTLLRDLRDETLLQARIYLKQSGFYSLRIKAMATALDSIRGDEHEIAVESDAPPQVVLQAPQRDLTLALGDKVQFIGTVDDDLRVSSIFQEIRINNGPWMSQQLSEFNDKHIDINCLWDPLEQHLKSGDVIGTRFVAIDSKGQRAESRIIQIAFASAGLVPSLPPSLGAQRSINKRIEELTRQTIEAAKALQDAKFEIESRSPNLVKQAQAFTRARQALDQSHENALEARELLIKELRRESDPEALDDLTLQSQVLNRVHIGELEPARHALTELSESLSTGVKLQALQTEIFRHATDSVAQGSSLAHSLKEAAHTRLAKCEAGILMRTAAEAAGEQEKITGPKKSAEQDRNSETLSVVSIQEALRRQQINQSVSADLQKDLQMLAEISAPVASRLKGTRAALLNAQQTADRLLSMAQTAGSGSKSDGSENRGDPGLDKIRKAHANAAAAGNALAKVLSQTSNELSGLEPALDDAEVKARNRLRNDEFFHAERIAQLAKEMSVLGGRKQIELPEKNRFVAQNLEVEASLLRAHAKVEASRRFASPLLDFELRTAAVALEAALTSNDAPFAETKAKIEAIARALQVLEAVAKLDEAERNADALMVESSEDVDTHPSGREGSTRVVAERLQRLGPTLRRAGLPEEAATAADASFKAFQSDSNRHSNESRSSLHAAIEATREVAQSARAALKSLAPSLATRMELLAEKSEAASIETRAIRVEAGKKELGVSPETLRSASELSNRIEDLREELKADASRQNTMSEDGRALARDSDAAAAQLKDSSVALTALKEASNSKTSSAQALERAADQQSQTAQKLRKMAEHFRNIESHDWDKISLSRKSLRNSEAQTGSKTVLENREKKAAALAEISSPSNEDAQRKLEQLAALSESENESAASAQSRSSTDSQRAIQQALKAARAGMFDVAERAIHSAAVAQEDASRLERSVEGIGQGSLRSLNLETAASDSRDLSYSVKAGDTRWGNLPKHIADDLMKGKRERSPAEYRSAIDAYFQAVAERARGGSTRP